VVEHAIGNRQVAATTFVDSPAEGFADLGEAARAAGIAGAADGPAAAEGAASDGGFTKGLDSGALGLACEAIDAAAESAAALGEVVMECRVAYDQVTVSPDAAARLLKPEPLPSTGMSLQQSGCARK
jgi:hypothetical protein